MTMMLGMWSQSFVCFYTYLEKNVVKWVIKKINRLGYRLVKGCFLRE
jgi:hypothetical protein